MSLSPDENKALHVPLACSPGVQGMNEEISACPGAFEHLDVAEEDMRVQSVGTDAATGDRRAAMRGIY